MEDIEDYIDLDHKYLHKIKNVDFTPIFILGMERSGTSILYKILSETNCFNNITSYHVINYSELLYNHINNTEKKAKKELQSLFRKKLQFERGIDKLKIMPDFPEEYRFILNRKTGVDHINNKSKPSFKEMCKKIQFISEKNRTILLKNPRDFTNFLTIKSFFPNSKFIFILRNPIDTLGSQVRAMKNLLDHKSYYMSLVSPKYSKLFDNHLLLFYYRLLYSYITPYRIINATNKMARSTKKFLININKLDKEDYICLKYENLCRNTNFEINKIIDFLDIKPQKSIDYNSFISPRKTKQLKTIKLLKNWIKRKLKSYITFLENEL